MRLILALALVIGAELGIRVLDYSLMPAPISATQKPLKDLPTTIGSWTGKDVDFDHNLILSSGAAEMINRDYQNPVGDQIAVNLGLWLDYEPVFPHRPEICYPNAGWEINNRKLITISNGGHPFKARLLSCDKHGQRIFLLYWVAVGSQVALDDGDMRKVFQQHRGFGQTRPPAIKVLMQTEVTDPDSAERSLVDFAEKLAPQLDEYER
jgi:EpsI family protein